MWRSLLRGLMMIVGVLMPLIVPFTLGISAIWIPFVTGHEYRDIRYTGLPASANLLMWSDWEPGAGSLQPSTVLEDLDPRAEIVGHRIGSAKGIVTRFTFYQAKYELPDGSIRIAHADGPRPLIGHRWGVLLAGFGLSVVCSAGLLFFASHLRRQLHVSGHRSSATVPESG